jgi:hypothetical protein
MANTNISRIGDPILSDATGETKYTKLTRHWYKKKITIE